MCEAKNLSKKVGQGAMNLFEQVRQKIILIRD